MPKTVCFAIVFAAFGAISASAATDIASTLEHNRSPADLARDARSKPAEVLAFFGAHEGMTVLDLFAGGGYYSEILAHVVGPTGRVYMHNNAAYLNFASTAIEARLASGQPASLTRYDRELDAIDLADDSVDLVLIVMGYHDLYYQVDGWDVKPDRFFKMIHRVLKPGGVLAIVDHAAVPGSGKQAAQDLHRIDPDFARTDIASHGFAFAGGLDALRNPDDDLQMVVFDEAVRGKTDKFVYKFVEPH